jgi:voltage-dependent calcium channel L type alpha-1D
VVWSTIFIVEASMKIVAMGFVFNGKGSYLRDPW